MSTDFTAYNQELYDQEWASMADMKKYGPTSRHQRRLIHGLLRGLDFASVLDTGCGVGDLLSEIQARYPQAMRLAGTDISQTGLDFCRRRLPSGTFTRLDLQAEHLPEVYDLTLSVDVLEHVPDDMAALRHIRAMTGRYFVVMTIQGEVMPQWEADVMGHVRNYRRGELQAKLEAAGFEVLRRIEWGWPFYSPLYRWVMARGGGMSNVTMGTYTWRRKLLAQAIYTLFWFNRRRRGDVMLLLAKPI